MSKDLKEILDYVDRKTEEIKKELEMLQLLKQYLEEKLSEKAPREKPRRPAGRRGEELTVGTLAAIESARWKTYRSGRGEWCFADELPKEFVDKLRKGPVEFQGRTYFYKKLSGGKEIVARR